MSENNDNRNIQARWIDLVKEAIVLTEEQKLDQVKNSCEIYKKIYEDNPLKPIVDYSCELSIDSQQRNIVQIKRWIGYKEDKTRI